jgi:NADH-quinone oxidoreductase subunit F
VGGSDRLSCVPLLDQAAASFEDYVAAGGGRGLEIALGAWPEAVIEEVAKSGLRGRGGAGFPTGEKWRSVRTIGAGPRFAICNGAEGEPATFKDRLLLRTNPYRVLEGLAIAAYAVGAGRAFVGLKETFAPEIEAVRRALEEMQGAGALGEVPIEIVLGLDLYLFGEETGLEEVIEERLPFPRVARPFMLGLFAQPPNENPTLVNNVETLSNVPNILADGPDWLRANGTETSPGTMLFTICGDVRREGVVELPLGTPLRHLVEEAGGGCPDGRAVKAIFPGASNTVIVPEQLDTPMDFDSIREVGTGLGAAGFAVFDESACIVRAAHLYSRFLSVESCGQCPACKFGTGEVTAALESIEAGAGSEGDVELVLVRARNSTDGQKCALPTGESLLMQSLVQVFGDEFRAHAGTSCPLPRELPFHKIVDWDTAAGRFAYDTEYARKQPDWTTS